MNPEEACNLQLDLENHYGYVYCVTSPSGKQYIGQSTRQWAKRWHEHKYTTTCRIFHNAISRYPVTSLSWELVCYADNQEELNTVESAYISSRNTLAPNGYNLVVFDNRVKSENNKWNDPEFLEHYSKLMVEIRRNDLGKAICFYEKAAVFRSVGDLIEAYPELKLNKGKVSACCRKEQRHHKGFHFYYTDDSIDDMKDYWASEPKKPTIVNERAVVQLDKITDAVIATYKSAAEAARLSGVCREHIGRACKHPEKYHTAGGFHWRYAEDA